MYCCRVWACSSCPRSRATVPASLPASDSSRRSRSISATDCWLASRSPSTLRLELPRGALRLIGDAVGPRLDARDVGLAIVRSLPEDDPGRTTTRNSTAEQRLRGAAPLGRVASSMIAVVERERGREGGLRVGGGVRGRGGHDLLRLRHAAGRRLGGGGRLVVGVARERVKLEGRSLGPESDDVAVLQQAVALEALAVDVGAVLAAQVLQHEALGLGHDRRVTRRDIEVALGVEADVGEGMTAEAEICLLERLDLSGARAGQELELGLHGVPAAQTTAPMSSAVPMSSRSSFQRPVARLLGGRHRRLAAAVHRHRIGAGFRVDQRVDLVADFLGLGGGAQPVAVEPRDDDGDVVRPAALVRQRDQTVAHGDEVRRLARDRARSPPS